MTGTDTGIGKTFVSAVLLKATGGSYWKPIQSGTLEQTDTEWVKEMTRLPSDHFFDETYKLTQPLSPHASAKIDGTRIDMNAFKLPACDFAPLIVEGAGGLMVPLNEDAFILDLIEQLNLPVVVVARSTLGTINHTTLTLNALRARKLSILGVVLNGEPNEGNKQAIEEYGKAPVIACVPPMGAPTPETIDKTVDYFKSGTRAAATVKAR
ncbi:MAG TPA: dethiobiotin synthase [Candidatus Obscuribacterales bacterium]